MKNVNFKQKYGLKERKNMAVERVLKKDNARVLFHMAFQL